PDPFLSRDASQELARAMPQARDGSAASAADLPEKQILRAQLRLGSVDRERAPQVVREPEVQHLAALAARRPGWARAVGPWGAAALVAARADAVRVPAGDGTARRRPPHA